MAHVIAITTTTPTAHHHHHRGHHHNAKTYHARTCQTLLGIVSHSAHVIKDYVAARRLRSSQRAIQARDMIDMGFIVHKQSVRRGVHAGGRIRREGWVERG